MCVPIAFRDCYQLECLLVHANVNGKYLMCPVSDIALIWSCPCDNSQCFDRFELVRTALWRVHGRTCIHIDTTASNLVVNKCAAVQFLILSAFKSHRFFFEMHFGGAVVRLRHMNLWFYCQSTQFIDVFVQPTIFAWIGLRYNDIIGLLYQLLLNVRYMWVCVSLSHV